jgi:Amt family ammonium transporter
MLGRRRGHVSHVMLNRPHNITHVVLGTVFLWFGWQGFNGGSALGANLRAAMALLVTNLAAAVGGLTWMVMEYRFERKWSTVGFCSGAIAGLVAITPASGYVPPWSAFVFGLVGAIVCNFATKLKDLIHVDDTMDVFAVHGAGAIVGNLMTGLFAKASIAALDGTSKISGGWLDGHFIQLGYQLADTVAVFGYTFATTCAILAIMNRIPGLHLRADEQAELIGMDDAELGEFAYDFVERARDHTHVVVLEGEQISAAASIANDRLTKA